MNKFFALSFIILSMIIGQSAYAQGGLSSLLNKAVGATSDMTGNSEAGNIISDLISKYTGSLTTTQENLIGTWSYSSPKVQFESENLLASAGGSTMASKIESKLALAFRAVGISEGRIKFTFTEDGKVSYNLGSKQYSGTYTFDAENKTVTFTLPKVNKGVTAYVTISGNNMSLCFDSSKVMALFANVAGKLSDNIGNIAGNYQGMKTGFLFTK